MLEGIKTNRIIVGAYTDHRGGVCPMLAAHRCGGRTSLASFAKAWDRYTKAGPRARPASERELRTLRAIPEASLAEAGYPQVVLGVEVSGVKEARREHAERAARSTGQGLVAQILRRGRTVEEAADSVEAEAERSEERELV